MDNSSTDIQNESQKNGPQDQKSFSETTESLSEIEKLYLKIKEDWL